MTYNQSFYEVKVAKSWGKTPEEFFMLSKENKLLMMAEVSASQKIESWLQDQSNDEHQRSTQAAEALARARGR